MKDNHPDSAEGKVSGGISAVMPARDEQENVESAVGEVKSVLSRLADRFEVIVVDDGSKDRTGEMVQRLASEDPRVRLVRHETSRGYGAALASGLYAAQMRYIFFTDADRQFLVAELEKLTVHLAQSRMVVGFRAQRQDPWLRRVYGRLFTMKVNLLFGLNARDVNCAFKVFERSIIEDHRFMSKGALINAELLAVAKSKGVEPIQVAVSHFPRKAGQQTGGSARVILRAMKELVKLYLHRP